MKTQTVVNKKSEKLPNSDELHISAMKISSLWSKQQIMKTQNPLPMSASILTLDKFCIVTKTVQHPVYQECDTASYILKVRFKDSLVYSTLLNWASYLQICIFLSIIELT